LLLVSTAAGAVGSVVGQLGRLLVLKTIGLTGSDEKADRLRDRFGFDVAINYRRPTWEQIVTAAAPDGVDIYFDNVGGDMLDRAIRLMRQRGRIVQCGTALVSSWDPTPTGLRNEREVLTRRLTWSGMIVFDYATEFANTVESLADAIVRGELVYDEDIDVGLESARDALVRVYSGDNHGKKLIFIG
jgi:NADPH-dependent curcumin reductase CurA